MSDRLSDRLFDGIPATFLYSAMILKCVEIRDRLTFIPAVVIRMVSANEAQRSLMARVGFRGEGVVLIRLNDQRATSDPYEWGDSRTMRAAHVWLERNFDAIEDGSVVDVEFILGESAAPVLPERFERYEG